MEPTPEERSHVVRVVAAQARDVADLTQLLDMLGLDPAEAREPRAADVPVPRQARAEWQREHRRRLADDLHRELAVASRPNLGSSR